MKLLKRFETFVDPKEKKPIYYCAFYLQLDNGYLVKIKPFFKDDKNRLKMVAYDYEE